MAFARSAGRRKWPHLSSRDVDRCAGTQGKGVFRHHRMVRSAAMRERSDNVELEEDICIHIFTVSAGMVGVCLTVIGLIRIVVTIGKMDTLADDMLAADSLLFLLSC